MKCSMPTCDQQAEVMWRVPAIHNTPAQEHRLCGSCMAILWSDINLKYHGSVAQECSTFEIITV